MADLVLLARFGDVSEALVARALLESEGLHAIVPDMHSQMITMDFAFTNAGFRLLVRDSEIARARAILRDAQSAQGSEAAHD